MSKKITFYTGNDTLIETVDAETVDPWNQPTVDFFISGGYAVVEFGVSVSPMITNNHQLSAYV